MEIRLTPIDEISIDLLKTWHNDVHIKAAIMGFRFPIQSKSIEDWLESNRKDNGINRVSFGIKANDQPVGIVSLNDIDYINSRAMLGLYIGSKSENNKGIGTTAATIILDFAFNGIGLNRVGLEVINNNLNAIRVYTKIGFVKEGTKRKYYFSNGKYLDVNCMSILRSEFIVDLSKMKNRIVYDTF